MLLKREVVPFLNAQWRTRVRYTFCGLSGSVRGLFCAKPAHVEREAGKPRAAGL